MHIKRFFPFVLLALVPGSLLAQISAVAGGTQMVAPIPLAQYAQGQAMMAEAARKAALLDINFTFLDKEYKDDTYATDPFGNKYRTGCYRFKATSGFRFKVDVPTFTLTNQGLTITQNISRIEANGLTAKFQVLACQDISISTLGVLMKDLKVVYTSRPMISFNGAGGTCSIGWNQDTDAVSVTIGDLNILNLQNDVDKLAKHAVEEAVNLALGGFFGSMMRGELIKISTGVCGQPQTRKR